MRPAALAILAALVLLAAIPAASAAAVSDTKVVPGKGAGAVPAYEENLVGLSPGMVIEWSWGTRSAGVLDFDIHWHDGTEIRTIHGPETKAVGGSGKFTVPDTRNVSFLWQNPAIGADKAVTISYDIRSVEPEKSLLPAPSALLVAGAALALALATSRRGGRA